MLSDVCWAASALVESVGVAVGGFRRRRSLAVVVEFPYGADMGIVLSVKGGLSLCVGLVKSCVCSYVLRFL